MAEKRKKVILFVDDDESVRLTITFALNHLGYHVLVATGASEALAHVMSHPNLDLMITDIRMADMSGVDLANQVREHHPEIKVMYCSGATPEWLAESGIKVSANTHLLKPVSLLDLKTKIERILGDPPL